MAGTNDGHIIIRPDADTSFQWNIEHQVEEAAKAVRQKGPEFNEETGLYDVEERPKGFYRPLRLRELRALAEAFAIHGVTVKFEYDAKEAQATVTFRRWKHDAVRKVYFSTRSMPFESQALAILRDLGESVRS